VKTDIESLENKVKLLESVIESLVKKIEKLEELKEEKRSSIKSENENNRDESDGKSSKSCLYYYTYESLESNELFEIFKAKIPVQLKVSKLRNKNLNFVVCQPTSPRIDGLYNEVKDTNVPIVCLRAFPIGNEYNNFNPTLPALSCSKKIYDIRIMEKEILKNEDWVKFEQAYIGYSTQSNQSNQKKKSTWW